MADCEAQAERNVRWHAHHAYRASPPRASRAQLGKQPVMEHKKEPRARVLVVDDEAGARSALTELLRDEGYEVHPAGDGYKALGQVRDWTPDIVVTDLRMPGLDGFALIDRFKELLPNVPVVVMTAFGSVESAVEALQLGAVDYVTKPLNFDHLLLVLDRVLGHQQLKREAQRLRTMPLEPRPAGLEMIGRSKAFADLLQLSQQIADSRASVLISGEAGTGKELIARAVHNWSSRRNFPFLSLRCGALTEAVLEVEMFGHPGNSPASPTPRRGRIAEAAGGTLFIDEIGRLAPALQVKLLRFLKNRAGEDENIPQQRVTDVRIIVATEEDLHLAVKEGRFREDLFYSLNVINLRVPSLQERRDDISLLAALFLRRHSERNRKTIGGFSERALGVLMNYAWPGNVRQLENCIERAVVLCHEQQIEPRHLPRELMSSSRSSNDIPHIPGASLAELERHAIFKTLEHTCGSTSKAAQILGISPRKIQYRLREYRDEAAADLDAHTRGPADPIGDRGDPP